MVRPIAALFFSVTFFSAALAQAQRKDTGHWDGGYDKTGKRRSDFTLGASAGYGLGGGLGYPNEVGQIDNPAYETTTGIGTGGGATFWFGGALRDWFTFALGGTFSSLQKGDSKLSGGGFVFRLEAFPLFSQGETWQDLGVSGNFGIGTATIEQDGQEKADGGSLSILGLGVFHETWRPGRFTLGPMVEYTHTFSQTLSSHAALAGVRIAFYSGPSSEPPRPAKTASLR
jgi:hypothetical protein